MISSRKQLWLVARRELVQGATGKTYRWVTAILAAVVAAAVLIPAAIADEESSANVGVVGAKTAGLQASADIAGQFAGVEKVNLESLENVDAARAALDSGAVEAVLINDKYVLIDRQPTSGIEASGTAIADSLARVVGLETALAGLPSDQQAKFSEGTQLPVRGVKPAQRPIESRLAGMAAAVIIYMFIFIYCQRIAEGIAEEKSSRVIEVLLSAVKPLPLLSGKVIGIGILSLLQLLAMAVVFVVCAAAVGGDLLAGDVGQVVAVGSLWLVLGYAFYCGLFAAAGAMVSRQSEASSLTTVLMIPMIATFSISFSALFSDPSTLFVVLAWIPLTAPVAMPVLFAVGEAGIADVIASAGITIGFTFVAFQLATLIYRRSVLKTGGRVSLREVFSSGD